MNTTKIVRAFHSDAGRVRMLGGDRALDMANTLHWRDGALTDFVAGYTSLAGWCVPALLLSAPEERLVQAAARQAPALARRTHADWLALRARLKDWLSAAAPVRASRKHAAEAAAHRAALLAAVSAALGTVAAERFSEVGAATPRADLVRLPLRRCAAAILMLLLFPPRGTVRQCQADACGGFFLDASRSKPRRWCAMDSCGNRMKATAFRKRRAG